MNDKNSEKKSRYSLFASKRISGFGLKNSFSKNPFTSFLSKLSDILVYTSTRAYGAAAFSYGLFSVFTYFIKFYNGSTPSPIYWIAGIAFCILAVALLIFDKPMCIALQDFPITDYLFFEFFLVKRMNKKEVRVIPPILAALVGLAFSALSIVVNPLYILLGFAVLVFVVVSFVTPEFPLIFGLLTAPYLSLFADTGIVMSAVVLVSFLSFVRKVALGKRVYNFEMYDVLIFALIVLFTVGGILNGDKTNFVMALLFLGYIPASNLIVNRRIADRALNSLIASSVPIAVIEIIKFFAGSGTVSELPEFFASSDAYLAYALLSAIFALTCAVEAKNVFTRIAYGTVFALHAFLILISANPGLYFAVLMAAAAAFVVFSKRGKKILLLPLLALPYLLFLLPVSTIDFVYKLFGTNPSYSVLIQNWQASFEIFKKYPVFGVGFSANAPGANMPITLLADFGILISGLLVILYTLSVFHISAVKVRFKESSVLSVGSAAALAIFAIASFGMTSDVFSDVGIHYLFIAVFGVFSSSMRMARGEYEDRQSYFSAQRSDDSYVVDMRIW